MSNVNGEIIFSLISNVPLYLLVKSELRYSFRNFYL